MLWPKSVYIVSCDRDFYKVIWLFVLVMGCGLPITSTRNPKSLFLMALGHECKTAMSTTKLQPDVWIGTREEGKQQDGGEKLEWQPL